LNPRRRDRVLHLVRSMGAALCVVGAVGACEQTVVWALHVAKTDGVVHALRHREHALPATPLFGVAGIAAGLALLLAGAQPAPPRLGARLRKPQENWLKKQKQNRRSVT
jgi:hypothetical protein